MSGQSTSITMRSGATPNPESPFDVWHSIRVRIQISSNGVWRRRCRTRKSNRRLAAGSDLQMPLGLPIYRSRTIQGNCLKELLSTISMSRDPISLLRRYPSKKPNSAQTSQAVLVP